MLVRDRGGAVNPSFGWRYNVWLLINDPKTGDLYRAYLELCLKTDSEPR